MLFTPDGGNRFDFIATNHAGRPSASMGTAVSAGSAANVLSTYQTILAAASVTSDICGVYININANTRSASARDTLVNIGASYAGAGAYTTIIPNLLGSCGGTMIQGGIEYFFPLRIPSGTAIGAQAQINSALLGNLYVYIVLYGNPRNPEMYKCGDYVFALGASPASSAGVAVTPGTTNEGAWTLLGTASSPAWYWQCGMGTNDATMSAIMYTADLGAGSTGSQAVIIQDQTINQVANTETISMRIPRRMSEYGVEQGASIWGRLQCDGTADAGTTMVAYGLGG